MGKYEIRKVASGIKFDLKAANGETVATSEVYHTESACLCGIRSVRKNGETSKLDDRTIGCGQTVTNPKYELFRDRAGGYRFRLRARNGQVILSSQSYTTKTACLAGVESVRKNVPAEEIERETPEEY